MDWCCYIAITGRFYSETPRRAGFRSMNLAENPVRALRWRHNEHNGVSNHQPHHCLLKRLFGCRSKKTTKLRVTGLCAGNSPGPVNSPHQWPVTRRMFPFDDVIMALVWVGYSQNTSSAGFTNLNPAPEGSLRLIPQPVARWAKTILQLLNMCLYWWRFIDQDGRVIMFTSLGCLWYCGDSTTMRGNDNITTAYLRHPGHCEFTEGLWSIIMLTSYQMWDYTLTPMIRGMISSSNIM